MTPTPLLPARRSTRLKQLYQRKGQPLVCITAPSPYAARMLQACGYEYTYVSGGITGQAMLGMPDNGTIGLAEFVSMAKLVNDCVTFPVACDVDACFGGIFHVERAVKELIAAGLAGIRIEDQPFIGKRFGGMVGKEIIPLGEAISKYKVAIDTRNALDPDFQVIARCEALTASNGGGLPDAIERMQAYEEAGVDVVHLEGPRSVDEIRAVRAAVRGPLTANFYNLPQDLTPQEAADLGLCEARYPALLSSLMHAAGWAMLQRFKTEGPAAAERMAEEFGGLTDRRSLDTAAVARLREMEERYLPKELLRKYDSTPEGGGITTGRATFINPTESACD